jgi:hypothetical protein
MDSHHCYIITFPGHLEHPERIRKCGCNSVSRRPTSGRVTCKFVNRPYKKHKKSEHNKEREERGELPNVNPSCSPRCLKYVLRGKLVKIFHVQGCPSRPNSPLVSVTSISSTETFTRGKQKKIVSLLPLNYMGRSELRDILPIVDWPNISTVLDTVQPRSAIRTLRSIAIFAPAPTLDSWSACYASLLPSSAKRISETAKSSQRGQTIK